MNPTSGIAESSANPAAGQTGPSEPSLPTVLATVSVTILLALPVGVSAQLTPIHPADDHFLCYKGKLPKGEVSGAGAVLDLVDMLAQPAAFDLGKERGSCNPADKNSEGIVDADTHLTVYQVKRQKGEAKFAKQANVRMVDQFGEVFLDTKKEDRILIPASKDDDPVAPLPAPPDAESHGVDHYKCYKAAETKGASKFTPVQVLVEDQWESPAKTYDLKKPKLLCLAVDKNGEGIKNDNAAVVCYQAKPAKGEPKHAKREGVGFADQIIAHRLDSKKEEVLCVPALKDPPDEYCGDLVVNQGGLEDCDGDATPCGLGEICSEGCVCVPPPYCGDGNIDVDEQCESNADCATGTTCTGACTCIDSQCPATVKWRRFDRVGAMITTSDFDAGYTGLAHNNGIPDQAELEFTVSSVTGSGPSSCGVATISGMAPSGRMCRCANDSRQVCDQPLEADVDDCGGEMCECYFDPPESVLPGGIPTCNTLELVKDATGTWNLDTGEGTISMTVDQVLRTVGTVFAPCPTCDGDVVLNDGVRDGTCIGGSSDGLSCDGQSDNLTFPYPGGGSASFDCFVDSPALFQGVFIDFALTTGASQLDAGVPCGPGEADLCHCGGCDLDETTSCTTNADCGALGPCRAIDVITPLPNACTDGTCTTTEPGQGECQGDPPFSFCDGVLNADGSGVIMCDDNSDCVPPALPLDVGNCTHTQLRPCYPDSIALSGTADPVSPYVVSTSCTPTSAVPIVNIVAGYPGPIVRQEQLGVTLPCAGDPGSMYPGCP